MLKIPKSLKNFQSDFAKIIATPFDRNSEENFQVQNKKYDKIFLSKIENQNNISSDERIQYYNRSYWFRLINLLQKEMPLTPRIIGLNNFNNLAMTYLEKYPLQSQILNDIANNFLTFIKEKHQWNNKLIKQVAHIEVAHIKSFDALHKLAIDTTNFNEEQLAELSQKKFFLQKHCFLIEESYNLMELYELANNEDDDSLLKPILQDKLWLIYRFENKVTSQELHPIQYKLLKNIQNQSLNDAIQETAVNLKDKELELFTQNLNQWFSYWIEKRIFYINE